MSEPTSLERLSARIAERLAELGMSERQASMLATGQPDAIRYIRTRGAMPSMDRLRKIADVLRADPLYLIGDTDENHWASLEEIARKAGQLSKEALRELGNIKDIDRAVLCYQTTPGPPRDFQRLDLLGSIDVATSIMKMEVAHILPMPEVLSGKYVLGFQLTDNSLSPVHNVRDFVLLEPERNPSVNDLVMVELGLIEVRSHICFMAQLIGRTPQTAIFRQLDELIAFQIPMADVSSMARVVSYSDLITG